MDAQRTAPPTELVFCRALNIIVALAGLVVASPLMLAIGILVKATSRGPVLFRQQRIGVNRRTRAPSADDDGDAGGRPFTMLKFRTMRTAHADAPQVWASATDPRITPVGHLLRRLRLDELPQLVNVLCGDMNVVGPRPEQPAIVRQLRLHVEGYARRHCVRPGITGLAQISLPYDQSIDDVRRKVELDLEYIRQPSPLRDLQIMARTPLVMLGRRGAL